MDRFKDWIGYLKLKNLSEQSIKDYNFYYLKFEMDKLSQDTVNSFIKRYNNPVCRAFISNLFGFINTTDRFPQETKDLVRSINIVKVSGRKKKKIPNYITREEMLIILSKMKSRRDKNMLLVSFYTGVRLKELINLRPYDFNWGHWSNNPTTMGKLKIVFEYSKGKKERIIPVIPDLMKEMMDFIKSEVSQKQSKDEPIFNIKETRWQYLLGEASKKALGKKISPHVLRHSYATHLIRNDCDLAEVQELLGHSDINTTTIYTHLRKDKLDSKVYEAFS